MERTTSNLLHEYQRGDFAERLDLFLQFPELRTEFMEMDRYGLHPEAPDSIPAGSRCHPEFSLVTLFGLNTGCMKRLFGMA